MDLLLIFKIKEVVGTVLGRTIPYVGAGMMAAEVLSDFRIWWKLMGSVNGQYSTKNLKKNHNEERLERLIKSFSVVRLNCEEALSSAHFCTYSGFSSTKVLFEPLQALNIELCNEK